MAGLVTTPVQPYNLNSQNTTGAFYTGGLPSSFGYDNGTTVTAWGSNNVLLVPNTSGNTWLWYFCGGTNAGGITQVLVGQVIAGFGLLLLIGYAFSWVFAFLGLLVKTPEAANSVGFLAVFPLTFISTAFVPAESLPTPLRQFADVNPFTIVVNELRWLWTGQPSPDHLWQAFAWVAFILVVFAPLAVHRYRRTAGR